MIANILIQERELFLAKLKEKSSFTALREDYQDKWKFHDLLMGLINDEDFKQACMDKSFGKSFRKDTDYYVELVNQAKGAAHRSFGQEVELQAYYTEINDADKILNINLINYNRNRPTRISDILQQEKDISKLNIYCNKKHDIHTYREDKKRYYEFKEGAYYEMTSTWPVKDRSGRALMCTMVINVSNDGITEVLKFNGESFVPSEEILELIKQNHELYIQGLSLYDAVKKSLEKNKAAALPDVVPITNNNLRNSESVGGNQGRRKSDLENDADNSSPSFNEDTSTQVEVNLQEVAVQAEISLQEIAVQTEINLQQSDQKLVEAERRIEELCKQNDSLQNESEEAKQVVVELEKQKDDLLEELLKWESKDRALDAELRDARAEKEKLNQMLAEACQIIESLDKQNADLLAQKVEGLASASAKIRKMEEEFKSICEKKRELDRQLESVSAKEEELKNELKKLIEERDEMQEMECELWDKLDQLERSNKSIEESKEQLLQRMSDLEKELSKLKKVNQALSDKLSNSTAGQIKSNQELIEARQEIEKLEERNNSLQTRCEEKEQEFKKEIDRVRKKIIQLNAGQEQKVQELYKKNEKLEEELKAASAKKKKLEDKLEGLEGELSQTRECAEQMIIEKCQQEKRSNSLLQKVEELKNELESREKQKKQLQGEIEEKIVSEYAPQLKLKFKGYEDEIEKLKEKVREWKEMCEGLKEVIADKVQAIENLKSESQNEKEGKFFRDQTEELKKDVHLLASKQIDFNQAYTITADVFSDPHNVPPKKRKLSKSLSLDSECDSDKERDDNLTRVR